MLLRLVCKVFGHQVNRKRVWDDSLSFRTNCARCHAPLVREVHGWREFDPVIDSDPQRKPHPRFDKETDGKGRSSRP